MAVVYQPIYLWDNIAERLGLTASLAGKTGCGVDKVTDGKHFTYYQPRDGENYPITFTMTGDAYIDTVIIQSKTIENQSDITVTYNGGTAFGDQTGLELFNIIKLETPIYVESLEIDISGTTNYYIFITHIWVGLSTRIMNPVYEFDEFQGSILADGVIDDCVYIKNQVKEQKRILQANFRNAYTEFDNLFNYNYRYCKPFMFAFRPDDLVYDGGLYHFTQDSRNNAFVDVMSRDVSIMAETPYMPTNLTRVVTMLIDGFDYSPPRSYLVDDFVTVNTSYLIDGFATIET